MSQYKIIAFILINMLLIACSSISLSERQISIPKEKWKSTLVPSFDFEIADTNKYYNVFLYLRHKNAYQYNNIWIRLFANIKNDTTDIQKEFVLANRNKWLGRVITGNIIEHYIPIFPSPIKLKQKNLNIQLEQIMRDDPLPNIMNVGIRIQPLPTP